MIDDNGGFAALEALARAGTAAGTHLWMQIGHAGRQTPRRVNPRPVAPSAVRLNLPGDAFGEPRALAGSEVEDVIRRFTHVATVARDAGFTGVQIHAAHGYLVSEFLSPLANRRTDRWGGVLENRARLLLEIVESVRGAVGREFPISVKLNSSDFQKGGFSHAECLQVVRWLEQRGVDLLEISGGNYEQPSMMGAMSKESGEPARESTVAREAYFVAYAESIRGVAARMPLMVTGGFRSRAAMDAALAGGVLDVIGIGRPMCVETDLPRRLIAATAAAGGSYEHDIRPAKAGLGWFCLQLIAIADGREPNPALTGEQAIRDYVANEEATAARLVGRTGAEAGLPA